MTMTSSLSLPPLPLSPPLPPGFSGSQTPPTFNTEPQLPLAVLPGDDLTRFVMKKNGQRSKPPKIGTGLAIVPTSSSRRHRSSHQRMGAMDITSGIDAKNYVNSNHNDSFNPPPFSIVATIAGRLVHLASNTTDTYYILSNTQRYTPTMGDRVIGVVEDTAGEYYRVNILGGHSALLHNLNFEGASKRNRPRLDPGSLVYCRVVRGVDDTVKAVSGVDSGKIVGGRVDPEVSCKVGGGGGSSASTSNTFRSNDSMDDDGGATRKDWTTSECTYGPLTSSPSSTSTSFRVSLGLARTLLLPTNETLSTLSKSKVPFEICVGVNGLIWVDAPAPEIVIMIQNAIRNGEAAGRGMVGGMVKAMVKNLRTQLE